MESNENIWKVLTVVSAGIALMCIGAIFTMHNNQRDLMNWRYNEFPLEKRLLVVEHQSITIRVNLLDEEVKSIRASMRGKYANLN